MVDHKTMFKNLAVGDIFHAESPNRASLICLVVSIKRTTIQARTVTTQKYLEFNRETGVAELGNEPVLCTIDSVVPLPEDIRNVILGIDEKFRLEKDLERLKLNDAEKRSLLYVDSYYSSNRL